MNTGANPFGSSQFDSSPFDSSPFDSSPFDEEFDISVALDPDRGRTAMLYTNGLDGYGFPELTIEPPSWISPPGEAEWPEFTYFLCRALWTMAIAVFEADGDEVLPFVTSFRGHRLTFWLAEGEPQGPATRLLQDEDSELREVSCSLWSAPSLDRCIDR